MNGNYVTGINENQVRNAISRITTNIEKLEARFNEIDSIVDSTRNEQSPSADMYRKQYADLRLNYEVIKKNMLSYINDLNNLIAHYRNNDATIGDQINEYKPINQIERYERRNEV